MKPQEITDRICSVLRAREMSYGDLSELLPEHLHGTAESTIGNYLNPESKQHPRLSWVLAVADALSLDYRWVLTGNAEWDEYPQRRVVVSNGDGRRMMEFLIPEGWPHLNLAVFPKPGEVASMTYTLEEES